MTKAELAERKERRRLWWLARLQVLRLLVWSVLGVAFVVLLPGLKNGIAGIEVYLPSPLELGLIVVVGYLAIALDEGIGGGKLITSPAIWNRKRKHAFIAGIGAIALIERLLG